MGEKQKILKDHTDAASVGRKPGNITTANVNRTFARCF